MSRDSSEERICIPKCTFEVYRAEGDSLFIKKKYTPALLCYTQGLRQKAEVLYNRGDFEFALVFFHRGHEKRPELQEFRLGIQKCEEAIRNALENTKPIRMNSAGAKSFKKQLQDKTDKRRMPRKPSKQETDTKQDDVPLHLLPPSRSRVVFSNLHDDHEYLKKMIQKEKMQKWRTACSEDLQCIAKAGLKYLDERSKFWHQEKPLYARKRAVSKVKVTPKGDGSKQQSKRICDVLQRLHQIDQHQQTEEHETAAKLAEGLREEVTQWTEDQLPNRLEVLANVNSMLGLSVLELSRYDEALEAHNRAYELGQKCNLPEIVSHAVDNIGRVHAKKGDYQSAIDVWQRKLSDCEDNYERIWLRYEIGRCNLELQRSESAFEYGDQALVLARELGDEPWQLNLNVLIGQAQLQMQHRNDAQTAFTKAYDLAKQLNAQEAEKAILDVMEEFQNTENGVDSESLNGTEPPTDASVVKSPSVA